MRTKVLTLTFGALIPFLTVAFVSAAHAATATCFCKISTDLLVGAKHATSVCQDLTGEVDTTFSGVFPQAEDHQVRCNELCSEKVSGLVHSPSVASACCAIGAPNFSTIGVFSAAGNQDYRAVQDLGVLVNAPPVTVTTCHCPAGWSSNTTQVVGGVTTDGKCKKWPGQPINISPLPPNGAQIGSWGFTWGNGVYAWGSQENQGAPHCVHLGFASLCTCPTGWVSNTSQVDGGVTLDGKCKKSAGPPINITPLPPDGTQIGTWGGTWPLFVFVPWGFTWGNSVYVWGSQANQGAPSCLTTTTSPAACGFF